MSDADATDPVKALREWCAINSFLCQHVLEDLRAGKRRGEAGERWMIRDVYAAALRSLEAAPALLARIEAGEGLLAAMQARAEKAERERDEARRLLAWCHRCNVLMALVVPEDGSYRCPKCATRSTPVPIREAVEFEERIAALESRLAINEAALIDAQKSMQMCASCGWLLPNHAEECGRYPLVVEQLRARLAEVAPVVEAAERLEPHIRTLSAYMDGSTACTVEQKGVKILGELRSAVRAARSLRGAGGGA